MANYRATFDMYDEFGYSVGLIDVDYKSDYPMECIGNSVDMYNAAAKEMGRETYAEFQYAHLL